MKKNCWEFKHCSRYMGGLNARRLGVCPATTDIEKTGINFGRNGGRYCWHVAGTLSFSRPVGTYASQLLSCISCDFFQQVKEEEGDRFQI